MAATEEWRRELETERTMKDGFMARDPESPFVVGRVPFHELRYFPPDPKCRVRATLERRPTPEEAYLRTNRDNQAVMRYIGDLTFSLGGEPLHLRLYHAGEGVGTSVFVPFRDLTSGRESYGAGRYLTLELNEADEYEVDFNRAFNPYCAYTDDFECAFPPSENDLPIPVRAGEKAWAADRNPKSPSAAVLGRARRPTARPSNPPPRRPGGSSRRSTGGRTPRRSR
ncbi:MAG TPA: DUF1684 domain-containing protein [Thermoplasmata archaeon]|jgi:hypothetical protein